MQLRERAHEAPNQREYRRRYNEGTISPPIPVTKRHAEALIRRAMAYDGLTRAQAEAAAARRGWVVGEVVGVLDALADDWLGK